MTVGGPSAQETQASWTLVASTFPMPCGAHSKMLCFWKSSDLIRLIPGHPLPLVLISKKLTGIYTMEDSFYKFQMFLLPPHLISLCSKPSTPTCLGVDREEWGPPTIGGPHRQQGSAVPGWEGFASGLWSRGARTKGGLGQGGLMGNTPLLPSDRGLHPPC